MNNKNILARKTLLIVLILFTLSAQGGRRFGMGRSIGQSSPHAPIAVPNAPPASAPVKQGNTAASTPVSPILPITPVAPVGPSSPNKPVGPSSPATLPSSPQQAQQALPARPPNSTPPVQAPLVAPQRSVLGGVLGGIATGIGISWLMHSMGWGIGEGMESWFGGIFLMILAIPILLFMIRRLSSVGASQVRQSMFGYGNSAQSTSIGSPNNPIQFTQYKPKNVGNDASARPWEGVASEPDLVSSSSQNTYKSIYVRVPEGFDVDGFVGTAKQVFLALQVAWDTSDMATLHSMLTDQMLSEIKSQLGERAQHSNSQDNQTEVITLHAELLGVQELDNVYMASVEFSGLIREDQTQGPNSFREVWSMSKQKDGSSGWLVCGVQALQ